jgi:serine/threonine protein phosphatase PrpC
MAKQQATSKESMAGEAATGVAPAATGVATHIGGRPNLEDRARAETLRTAGGLTLTVAMVADGIGGNVQGERAAELAIETAFNDIRLSTIANAVQLPLLLSQALQRANTAVFEEGRADRSRRGMGTTAVLAAVHNNQLYLANIGDSRAYLIRDGAATQITRDHTWAFEMHRQRLLTEAEIAKHPKRHELVRSIGYGSTVDVDLGIYTNGPAQDEREASQNQGLLLQANDRLVLCSDGLIKEQRDGAGPFVPGDEMARIVGQRAPAAAAEALVARAVSRHADDNVSAVVVEMPGSKRAVASPSWLPLALGGVAALLLISVLAFFLLRGGNDEPTVTPLAEATQPAETAAVVVDAPSPTLVAVPAGQVAVLAAGGGRWETGEASGALAANTTVPLPAGQRVTLISDSGVAQVALSDGTQLFLGAGAAMGLTAEATGTTLALDRGRALVRGGGAPVTVGSLFARAALLGPGLLGLYLEPSSLLFEAACLVGDCEVIGTADSAPLRLPGGQAAVVGSASTAGAPEPANFDAYAALAPDLVPRPTATATATPTETPTATATIRPPTRVPTATPRPAVVPSTTVPEATATNRPNEPGDPEPTDVPKPPATELPTEPPPPPTTEPTPKPGG